MITDIIDDHGGILDKYIGDAVIGVFGAPVDDPNQALHAVQTAIACQRQLAELQQRFGCRGSQSLQRE